MYWDGSFGVCCSEKKRFTADNRYNLRYMTVEDWYKCTVMADVRDQISGDSPLVPCSSCYSEEVSGYESRRFKENFKSAIFTEKAFERSYLQSPWHSKFESRTADPHPIDWHVDFGNECNLACKMCNPDASSAIAAHLRRSGDFSGSVKTSWTLDDAAWNNFLRSVDAAPLRRVHVMGGEPMLIKRYHEFIDYLIAQRRFDISLSFVTNGTILNQELIDKLKKFASADIEISIESIHSNNDYIRQGSDIRSLMRNIELVKSNQNSRLQLVLRTVPQLLSIGTYVDLVRYAYENSLIIEGIPLTRPPFLAIKVLPLAYRKQLIPAFKQLADEISSKIQFQQIQNGRSLGTINEKLKRECMGMISMLDDPEPKNVADLRKQLVQHLTFWDRIYSLDARDYYDFAEGFGYGV